VSDATSPLDKHDADYAHFEDSGEPHPYHLVNPSPWPFAICVASVIMMAGIVSFMHGGSATMAIIGLVGVVVIMGIWFRDVVHEHVVERAHSAIASIGFRYGMALFIASEVMFFVAFFWAYFDAGLFPSEAIGGTWPPEGMATIPPFDLPLLMTMLLLSGCSCTWAHAEILEGNKDRATTALAITVGLGFLFLGFQVYEYTTAHFGFAENVYSSAFFMATGFHGFHVFIGATLLAVCLIRNIRGHFKPDDHFGFEAAAWYWHFVDVVWLFLFVAVYWWGAGEAVAH